MRWSNFRPFKFRNKKFIQIKPQLAWEIPCVHRVQISKILVELGKEKSCNVLCLLSPFEYNKRMKTSCVHVQTLLRFLMFPDYVILNAPRPPRSSSVWTYLLPSGTSTWLVSGILVWSALTVAWYELFLLQPFPTSQRTIHFVSMIFFGDYGHFFASETFFASGTSISSWSVHVLVNLYCQGKLIKVRMLIYSTCHFAYSFCWSICPHLMSTTLAIKGNGCYLSFCFPLDCDVISIH